MKLSYELSYEQISEAVIQLHNSVMSYAPLFKDF